MNLHRGRASNDYGEVARTQDTVVGSVGNSSDGVGMCAFYEGRHPVPAGFSGGILRGLGGGIPGQELLAFNAGARFLLPAAEP